MTSNAFTVREITTDDFDQWHPLWQGYLSFYESSLPDSVTQTLWRRLLDTAHEIEGRVAARESDGQLVGLVHFFPHVHSWYEQPVCYLNDLFAAPDVRGGGIGAALIETVLDEAKGRGWAEVYWHTQQNNSVARGLYDKITGGTDGFVNYSISLLD